MIPDKYIDRFLPLLLLERERQEELHGEANQNNSWDRWLTILGEEFGEVCKANLEKNIEDMEEELIQVAAVCFSIYQRLQERKKRV